MKQILHIFAKDARHFWLESLLSAVLVATYVWITPSTWASNDTSHVLAGTYLAFPQQAQFVSMILALLIAVSWWLLIARVVHAEGLVGDRQFWLTRPYEWKNLLVAKLLFLLVFSIFLCSWHRLRFFSRQAILPCPLFPACFTNSCC